MKCEISGIEYDGACPYCMALAQAKAHIEHAVQVARLQGKPIRVQDALDHAVHVDAAECGSTAAARAVVLAYEVGEARGGSVEWEDLDRAYELAKDSLPPNEVRRLEAKAEALA